MSKKLMTIPLSKLERSTSNIRKTDATSKLEELAASIAAHGLLQNLTVQPIAKQDGKSSGRFAVVAGGRRLAALKLLAKRKRIAKNVPVPCRLLIDDDPVEVSLAENVVRVSVHPADQFEAFSKLHVQGLGVEEIAARFGVSSTVVRQRLKLAAVSPRLMEVYRKGDMTLDQLVAFTLTDDHEAQERVWFDDSDIDKLPQAIRRMLTKALVEGSDRRARFVGAEAYEAGGGTIIRDLFRPDDDGYFTDSQLLNRLVAEKLAAEAERIKADGWAWVEVLLEMDYGHLTDFRRIPSTEVPLSTKEEATFEKLSRRHDELIMELEDDPPSEVIAELDRVAAEIDALSERKAQWSDEDKARSGVVISLDYEGSLSVTRGLVRPDPKDNADAAHGSAKGGRRNKSRQPRSKDVIPAAVLENLSAHKTAALRETLAAKPKIALVALVHTLVLRTFFGASRESCIDVRPITADLRPSAEGIGESKAVAAMANRHRRWIERLPDPDKLWPWLVDQSDKTKLELLAYCTAMTVNALRRRHDGNAPERLDQAEMLATTIMLDMADWWEPTREHYLDYVSKTQIGEAVSEAVSRQAADNLARMKKPAMATRAEELIAGRRWLPEVLRTRSDEPEVPA